MKRTITQTNTHASSLRGRRLLLLMFFTMMLATFTSWAQFNSITTVPPYGVNGTFGVTFNVKAYGHKVIIKRLWTEMATTGSNTLDIYYKTDSISAAPNVNTQPWILGKTVTFTSTASQTAIDSIPGLLNIEIPAGKTYGFWISNPLTFGGIYYRAPGTGDTSFRYDGNIHLNMGVGVGYGGGAPVVVTTPRQFCGRIEYEVVPNPPNNASISLISSPPDAFCAGSYPIKAIVTNNGSNRIDSVRVRWTLDGVPQTGIDLSTPIDTPGHPSNPNSLEVTLGTVNFTGGVGKTIKVWTSHPNGIVDTVNIDDTVQVVKRNALNGTYTIDPAGSGATNYTTFTAAAAALKLNGICGPVVFNVAPGTYNERVEILGIIAGSSATNTITFEGTNAANRIINYNSTGDVNAFHTVKLEGVHHFYFRNFTVNALGTDNGFGIVVRGGGVSNVFIRKCIVNVVNMGSSTSANFGGIIITGQQNAATAGSQKVDSMHVDSNVINGGYYGLVHFGTGGGQDRGCTYDNNTINNVYQYGAYIYYHDGCKIRNNTIRMRSDNPGSSAMFLSFLTGTALAGSTEISGNRIPTFNQYGIYLTTATNLASNKGLIINNMIGGNINHSTSYGTYGLYMSGTSNWSIANNSIHFATATSNAIYSPLYVTGSVGASHSVMNNIFSTKQTGSLGLAVYLPAGVLDSMDYNIFYRQDTSNGQLVFVNGTTYNSGAFKGASGFNANSIYSVPGFINDTNLHISNGCAQGISLPYVTTDFDGNTRGTPPTRGASEYNALPNDMSVVGVISPVSPFNTGAQDLYVRVKNTGGNSVSSFDLSYSLNGGAAVTQTFTSGTLNPCDTITLVFTGSQQITLGSANTLKIYTSNPNATSDTSRLNDTLNVTMLTPLSGTYSINAAGSGATNFPSFAAATAALNTYGLAGPVVFNVAAGTYNEQVVVAGTINGLSAANTVTFDGGTGNAATRIITANIQTTGTIVINQKSYISFRNLSVVNTNNNSNPAVIHIIASSSTNAATGCAIKNCIVSMPNMMTLGNQTVGIIVTSNPFSYNLLTSYADSIEIDSNTILGGYYGISFTGGSSAAYNRSVKIRNNIINAYWYGIYVQNLANAIDVTGNTIQMYTVSGSGAITGIYFVNNNNTTSTPTRLNGNKITSFTNYGMYLAAPGGVSAAPLQIYNNMISSATSAYNDIFLSSTGYTDIYHNTLIYNSEGSSSSYGALYSQSSANVNVKNNILGVEATAGSAMPAYFASNPTGNAVNYNVYYNKANAYLLYRAGFYDASTYHTSSAGGDSSFNLVPAYINAAANDFHITTACFTRGLDLTSIIPTDIDGNTRNVPPQVGADENPNSSVDLMVDALISPAFPVASGSQSVVVRVRNNGGTTISSFNAGYRVNSGTPVTQAFSMTLNPCDTATITFTTPISITSNVQYGFKVYTYNPNSSADGNPVNDTVTTTLITPLNGSYTVGPVSSDYSTIAAATAALQQRGISGNVTFNLRTGTFNERMTINPFQSSSASNYLTIRSNASNADSVVVQASNTDGYCLAINNVSNVVVKNLTFQNGSTTTAVNGINLTGTCSNDSIVNCKVLLAVQSSVVNYSVYASPLSGTNLVIKNNLIQGGYYGVNILGASTSARIRNMVFDANTVQGAYIASIYQINNHNRLTFTNNKLIQASANSFPQSFFYYIDSTLFSNNVWIAGASVTQPYIYLGLASVAVKILNNSFTHASTSGGGYFPLLYNSTSTGWEVKNNVFNCTGTGNAMYWNSMPTAAITDYNDYFTNGSNLIFGASSAANLNVWKSTCNCDKNSLSMRPGYTNVASNLAPNPADSNSWALNGRGIHHQMVTRDFNGTARPASVAAGVPDIGAYEFTPTVTPPLLIAVPATPVAGGTQSFLSGTDTVAKVIWDNSVTPPGYLDARLYSGTKVPNIGTATNYMNAYWSFSTSPSGSYLYTMILKYKDAWLGTNPLETDLKMAKKDPSLPWVIYNGTASTVDTGANTLTAPNLTDFSDFTGTDSAAPLPVVMLSFNGHLNGKNTDLTWFTSQELNSMNFTVERLAGSERSYKGIGTVEAAGNSSTMRAYSFTDVNAASLLDAHDVIYYRLRMTDMDGRFAYSNTIAVRKQALAFGHLSVSPNPFSSNLTLGIELDSDVKISFELMDINGRSVNVQSLDGKKGTNILAVNPGVLDNGIYFARITTPGSSKVVKLIKQ